MKSDASEVCEIDNLKNENAILNLQVTILTHRLSTIEEENDVLREQKEILRNMVSTLEQRTTDIAQENLQLKSGYPANTKAMLDKICQLTRNHESLVRKLNKKNQELAALKKERKKLPEEKTTPPQDPCEYLLDTLLTTEGRQP